MQDWLYRKHEKKVAESGRRSMVMKWRAQGRGSAAVGRVMAVVDKYRPRRSHAPDAAARQQEIDGSIVK